MNSIACQRCGTESTHLVKVFFRTSQHPAAPAPEVVQGAWCWNCVSSPSTPAEAPEPSFEGAPSSNADSGAEGQLNRLTAQYSYIQRQLDLMWQTLARIEGNLQ